MIGTLFSVDLVNFGELSLRRTRPDKPLPYRVSWSPVLPFLGVLFAVYLMTYLPGLTWVRFGFWLLIGFVIYWLYGYRHSRLRGGGAPLPAVPPADAAEGRGSDG